MSQVRALVAELSVLPLEMYYVYAIRSVSHNTRYVGNTDNVEKRIDEYNAGKGREFLDQNLI